MARDFKRSNKLAVISDLNVTPLIDLAFSLLIIFMITTPVIEQYNRIDLPDQPAENIKPPPPIEDKFITIDAEGSYHWGTDPVSATELEARLDAVAEMTGDQPVIHIRGDKVSATKNLWTSLTCSKSKFEKIEFGYQG